MEAEQQGEHSDQQTAAGAADEQLVVIPKKKGGLAKRVVFGVILGVSGAGVIIVGGWLYCFVTCLAAYQLSQVRTHMGSCD